MIFHDVEGGSAEWSKLRLGIPCSSSFHRIITPKTLKFSKQASAYMYVLLAEWISGEQVENYQSQWMERGHTLEDKAILAFEGLTDLETKPGGFITTDDGLCGCSPDRLIGDDSDLEIKCGLLNTQVEYALKGSCGEDYMCQLQGRMMIHGRESVQIFAYHPNLTIPPMIVPRDDKMINAMRPLMDSFIETMLKKREELMRRFGPFPGHGVPSKTEPGKVVSDFVTDEDVELILKRNRETQDPAKRVGAYLDKIGSVAWAKILRANGITGQLIDADKCDAICKAMDAEVIVQELKRSEK